jgi:hypothetical protein
MQLTVPTYRWKTGKGASHPDIPPTLFQLLMKCPPFVRYLLPQIFPGRDKLFQGGSNGLVTKISFMTHLFCTPFVGNAASILFAAQLIYLSTTNERGFSPRQYISQAVRKARSKVAATLKPERCFVGILLRMSRRI